MNKTDLLVTVEVDSYSGTDTQRLQRALADITEMSARDQAAGAYRQYVLRLENREYRLDEMLAIRNVQRLYFDGNGASLVWTRLMDAIKVFDSVDVRFSNFTVDYDPLPFTQGIITSVKDNTLTVEVDLGYRTDVDSWLDQTREMTLHVHDARTMGWKDGYDHQYYLKAVHLTGRRTLTVELMEDCGELTPRVGDLVSIKQNCFGTIGVSGSRIISFSNVSIYSAPFFGYYEVDSEGGTCFNRFSIIPGPRPVGAVRDRVRSTNGDGCHFQSVHQGPLMEHCTITHCGDDCINAHGFFYRVVEVQGTDVLLSVKMDSPMAQDDRVTVYERDSYETIGEVALRSFRRIEDDSYNAICDEIWRGTVYGYRRGVLYRVTLSAEIPGLKRGDHFSSQDRIASRATIRHSIFGFNRANGIVLKGRDVCIENNLVTGCTHEGIRVISDLAWAESGIPSNAVIRGNTVVNCILSGSARKGGGAVGAITVTMDAGENGFRECFENRNILIENNIVMDSGAYGIFASNCTDLTLRNNRVIGPFKTGINRLGQQFGLTPHGGILVGMTRGAVVEGNTVRGCCEALDVAVEIDETCTEVSGAEKNALQ